MSSRPFNVMHVMADQLHAGLMGCAGHPQVLTPNLDAFAAGGVRFSNVYCQNPICTPSRVSILSGQYCHNTGYYGLSGPTTDMLPSFLSHFRQHGYRTGAFGKVHVPNQPRLWLTDHVDMMADSYERTVGEEGASTYFDFLESKGVRHLEDSWHNFTGHYSKRSIPDDARVSDLPYEYTHEVWSMRDAFRFIDTDPSKPFCVHLSFQKPHHPLFPQQKFWDMYDENLALPATINQDPSGRPPHFQAMWKAFHAMEWEYNQPGQTWEDGARRAWRGTLACVTQIDDVFGMILKELRQRGLADNTIVIFHSDHGCYHGMQGIVEKAPGICSDYVCRVPMIWQVPGVTPAQGAVCTQLVENIDIAATLPRLCGVPDMRTSDGCNIIGLLRGDPRPVRQVAVTENAWSKSIRFGPWRFVHYQPGTFRSYDVTRALSFNQGAGGTDVGELYHIENDPDEKRNLYHDPQHQAVVEEARRRLLEWLIASTRVRTAWPYADRPRFYDIAEDGKEANTAGPWQRVRQGQVNYV